MQPSIESDFEDENEICYTSKRRAQPIPQHYDDDSWTNAHDDEDDDQHSSSIDYYYDDQELDTEIFNLPPSATDLPVTARQALHLATIYEFLRHFSSILRLSPFYFEHFCTSIVQSNEINNKLFSHIHISLLRLLIKQDDDDGITYASEIDIKGIIDLSFVTMDYLTWPYILQLYVNSHSQLKYLSTLVKHYPFDIELDEKIELLLALCDVVLTTKTIRREFDDTKPKQHDDNCRQCQKRGDLLCCDRCQATYHLYCLQPPLTSVPTVEWFCPVCIQNELEGVTDCIPPREHRPYYLRHRCIGHDREQRRYWFVCRRLFIEDEFGHDVRYYSTIEQFEDVLQCLDEHGPERLLVYRLQKRFTDIERCMQLTLNFQRENLFENIKSNCQRMMKNEENNWTASQLDGIVDEDFIEKREFFKLNSKKPFFLSLEDRLRHEHNISSDVQIAVPRLSHSDIDERVWQRYDQYRRKRGSGPSYPRSNYYRDYYTGNNYEDEDGFVLDNEYDDFGDDCFQQDELDQPFRKYEYHRGTSRGRPRGRGRPPLYGHRNQRAPRGVNHLTTGSFARLTAQPKPAEQQQQQQPRNKRKPTKMKSNPVTINDDKPKRPGKILRSGRISRKPRRDSETDFGSDNSDDSGAKDKETGSDDDEFHLTKSNDFATFAQNQLLATNLNIDDSDDDETTSPIDIEDDLTYNKTMLSLINSMQPGQTRIDFDCNSTVPSLSNYENFYLTNPLATRKQMLLNERDRRAHLARKFSINHSPTFAWYTSLSSPTIDYTLNTISETLRLTLVHFENTIPYPFMHARWKHFRYNWAKELLDFKREMPLTRLIYLLLQFETCIKSISYFDLFTDQIGYLKFRRETEKERDEAKKEEKDALIRRKFDVESIVQNVHFTRPLKHTVYKQRGEEYRLTGGQGWTFIRSTRRSSTRQRQTTTFDINSLLSRREQQPKPKASDRYQLPIPWTFTYDANVPPNIFILPSHIIRRLARGSMSVIDVPGFLNSKLSGIGTRFGWPYPCGRPAIRTAWCFKVQTSSSLFALAHHVKYLWNCIRWDLLTENLATIEHDPTTTILAKRDSGPYESVCEYFVRKTIQPQTIDSINLPVSKSRSRGIPPPTTNLTSNQLIITEQWLPERQLQPSQIKLYYQCLLDKSTKRANPPKKKSFLVRVAQAEPQQKTFSVVKLSDGQILLVPIQQNVPRPPPPAAVPQPQPKIVQKPPEIDPVCRAVMQSMLFRIERALSSRVGRTNLLNERIGHLRDEFLTDRRKRRTAFIKQPTKKPRLNDENQQAKTCVCRRTNLAEKFFIQCELCSRWLHGSCAGLTAKKAEKIKEYICKDCRLLTEKAKERLYCVCQQPYDESEFYIGCDICADWLHGSCVKITPDEAEKFEVYVCPKCSTDTSQQFLNHKVDKQTKNDLLNLTEQLVAHQMAWPFLKPVDSKDVPNYYTVIKDPMGKHNLSLSFTVFQLLLLDLTTLKTKLLNSKFDTVCDYVRDVNKIFNNCRQFNPIHSTLSQCANVVDNTFRSLLEDLMMKTNK